MNQFKFQTAAARLKKLSRLRPMLAIVLGSGFHHALTELRVAKSPLHGGMGWIKVTP
jgi:purine nucleoside phosphorylase